MSVPNFKSSGSNIQGEETNLRMRFLKNESLFLSFILANRITRNKTSRKRNIFCLVAFTLPSETETDEPRCNQKNPLLAIEVLSAYLDA